VSDDNVIHLVKKGSVEETLDYFKNREDLHGVIVLAIHDEKGPVEIAHTSMPFPTILLAERCLALTTNEALRQNLVRCGQLPGLACEQYECEDEPSG
jgi:hypothetical protein